MPGLGRIYRPDDRDQDYPMSLALDMAAPLPVWKYWPGGPVLDQGNTPHCVAYATTGWEEAEPIMDRPQEIDAPSLLYQKCQAVDGIRGPHDGTTVRAALKVMQAEGRIANYLWARHLDDLVRWVLTKGSVIMGTIWTEGMFSPNKAGIVRPEGRIVGGHSWLVLGANVEKSLVCCRNSWGEHWGIAGNFWVRFSDLDYLLSQGGEACAATEVKP